MLTSKIKKQISEKVQAILQEVNDDELPGGGSEINFLLHIDGTESWSWTNIRNSKNKDIPAPNSLACNETIPRGMDEYHYTLAEKLWN